MGKNLSWGESVPSQVALRYGVPQVLASYLDVRSHKDCIFYTSDGWQWSRVDIKHLRGLEVRPGCKAVVCIGVSVTEIRNRRDVRDAERMVFECRGERIRKRGRNGGDKSRVADTSVEVSEHRPWSKGEKSAWKRGMKAHYKQTLREERAINTIKASEFGLMYKSNPCPTKKR